MTVSVCGSVYLSASISPELRIKSPPFLRLSKLAVTWSSWQACNTLCTCVYGWRHVWTQWQKYTYTHRHRFNDPFSGTTRVSRYQNGKTNLDFTEARDSEWQWHLLGHMQDCTVLQTDNHASTPPLSFFTGRSPSCHPANSVKALKALLTGVHGTKCLYTKWHSRWQHRFDTEACTQTDSPWGSTSVGLESCGICSCLVTHVSWCLWMCIASAASEVYHLVQKFFLVFKYSDDALVCMLLSFWYNCEMSYCIVVFWFESVLLRSVSVRDQKLSQTLVWAQMSRTKI